METVESRAHEILQSAYARFSREELAQELGVSLKRIERWDKGNIADAYLVYRALNDLLREQPSRAKEDSTADFTFIDLFAGIGGTRLGFEQAGGECVFTSEYDQFCRSTYRANFRPDHPIVGDIRSVTASSNLSQIVPDHDILVAGFPCQPFSVAGVSKKNALGRAHGFECETQGTLFFDICRIIEAKRPIAFLLENVKNLKSHDSGNTFKVIVRSLRELGYEIDPVLLDAQEWAPQHRERIFIAGFRAPTAFQWGHVRRPSGQRKTLVDVLHPEDGSEPPEPEFTVGTKAKVNPKYTLTTHLWNYLQDYARKHQEKGNGFGFGLVTPDMIARTLSARYFKDGSEILVSRGKRKNPRRLTPRECARIMGFPDTFRIPVSDTQAYKQFGNSVVVPVIRAIATAMRPHVLSLRLQEDRQQIGMAV